MTSLARRPAATARTDLSEAGLSGAGLSRVDRGGGALRVALVIGGHASATPGGKYEAVRDQERALRAVGHEVTVIAVRPRELARGAEPLKGLSWSAPGRDASPVERLAGFAPDVVHVHDLAPDSASAWVWDWQGPVVATLYHHHHRPQCPAGGPYRAGPVCARCADGGRWAGRREGCDRGPRTAPLPAAWSGRGGVTAGGVAADPLLSRADRLVVLSELSRRTYERAGLPGGRPALVPHFVSAAPRVNSTAGKGRWVFVGRLGAEDGILELLRRWPQEVPLDVVGDGELDVDCRAAAAARGASVRFLGTLGRQELRRRLPSWRGLVFPGRCPERVPLVYAEALAARFPARRAHCVRVFGERYSEPVWVARTTALYTSVLHGRGAGRVDGVPGAG
ncbi:glycosyltransferase [Streptomyces sp. NPDC091272]|uniref:glycosyltransferase n=1 Tax=Streptomyces sp. NPDC091272 TaxID=3365981 RepID=UPI003817DA33